MRVESYASQKTTLAIFEPSEGCVATKIYASFVSPREFGTNSEITLLGTRCWYRCIFDQKATKSELVRSEVCEKFTACNLVTAVEHEHLSAMNVVESSPHDDWPLPSCVFTSFG